MFYYHSVTFFQVCRLCWSGSWDIWPHRKLWNWSRNEHKSVGGTYVMCLCIFNNINMHISKLVADADWKRVQQLISGHFLPSWEWGWSEQWLASYTKSLKTTSRWSVHQIKKFVCWTRQFVQPLKKTVPVVCCSCFCDCLATKDDKKQAKQKHNQFLWTPGFNRFWWLFSDDHVCCRSNLAR